MSEPQIISRSDSHTIIRSGVAAQQTSIPNTIPLLPIRNLVVFPGTVMPLNIGRPRSKAVIDEVMPGDKLVGVIAQKNAETEDPAEADLYAIGVVCTILKLLKLNDGNQSIIVHGLARFRVKQYHAGETFPMADIEIIDDAPVEGAEIEALIASVKQQAMRVVELSPNTPDEVQQVINSITSASALADFLSANINAEVPEKQALLEELSVAERLKTVAGKLAQQLDMLELQAKIQGQVKESIDKNQRRYYLQEQVKAIRRELGEVDAEGNTEVENLRARIQEANLPENVQKEADRELSAHREHPAAKPRVRRHPHVSPDPRRPALVQGITGQDRPQRVARDPRPRSSRPRQGETPDHRIPRGEEVEAVERSGEKCEAANGKIGAQRKVARGFANTQTTNSIPRRRRHPLLRRSSRCR